MRLNVKSLSKQVEIVDVSSSKFHRVQQGQFSKLLNLQIQKKGAHLRLSRFTASRENALFSVLSVSTRWAPPVELC